MVAQHRDTKRGPGRDEVQGGPHAHQDQDGREHPRAVGVHREAAQRPFYRPLALLVSLVLIALTLWPALREQPYDSFPLSTFPMFSTVRKTSYIHVIVGFDAQGEERKIPPQLVANFEVMQAAQTVRRAIRSKRAKQLCEEVAAKGYEGFLLG